jgi:hypothetical protein
MSLDTVAQDLLWNFQLLTKLQPHQYLRVDGDRLGVDEPWWPWGQAFTRYMTRQSRSRLVLKLRRDMVVAEELADLYQMLPREPRQQLVKRQEHMSDMKQALQESAKGLKALTEHPKYHQDRDFLLEVAQLDKHRQRLAIKYEQVLNDVET